MKYFTIKELSSTNTGLPNIPPYEVQKNLEALVENVLDPLRVKYGKSIRVNSGYRSAAVNAKVKGAKNSDHLYGYAADITAGNKVENKKLFELIRDNFDFKQLINEYNYSWVHVSWQSGANRKQILKIG